MPISTAYLLLTLLATASHAAATANSTHHDDRARRACSATLHPALCLRSLAPLTSPEKQTPRWFSRAAVSATLAEARKVKLYLHELQSAGSGLGERSRSGSRRVSAALSDCTECLGSAAQELRLSLGTLRRLRMATFVAQMEDVETWVSAALTYENTCLDGFATCRGREVEMARGRVVNATYLTSNALALVNQLASGGEG